MFPSLTIALNATLVVHLVLIWVAYQLMTYILLYALVTRLSVRDLNEQQALTELRSRQHAYSAQELEVAALRTRYIELLRAELPMQRGILSALQVDFSVPVSCAEHEHEDAQQKIVHTMVRRGYKP